MLPQVDSIRPAHVPRLRRLFKQAVETDFNYFPAYYQRRVLNQNTVPKLLVASVRPTRAMFGVHLSGQLNGFVIGNMPGDRTGQIHWLYTAPHHRSQGLGGLLLNRILDYFREYGCTRAVLVTHNFQSYYAKRGFVLDKVSREFERIDMHLMSLNLGPRKIT